MFALLRYSLSVRYSFLPAPIISRSSRPEQDLLNIRRIAQVAHPFPKPGIRQPDRLKWYAIFSLFMLSPHSDAAAIADRNDFITSDFGRTTVVNNHGGDVANHPIFGAIEHPNFAVVV